MASKKAVKMVAQRVEMKVAQTAAKRAVRMDAL